MKPAVSPEEFLKQFNSVAAIHETLLINEIKGYRNCGNKCPIAILLQTTFNQPFYVDENIITNFGKQIHFYTSDEVANFIVRFDNGEFPEFQIGA